MPRKPVTDMSAWPSLTLEGNLIAPAMVAKIDRREAPEQAEESYGIRKGLTVREEISTSFRVGQSHFDAFAKAAAPSIEATRRFVRDFLKETFGFDDLAPADGAASLIAGGRVPVVVVPPAEALDRRSPTLSTDRARSPAFALQDHLNDSDGTLWGLVTNGTRLRLMRDNASLTRPAYIEADLAQIFTTEDAASFTALWLLIHRSRFGRAGATAADCALERWRDAGSREGEAARDRLAGQVEDALRLLGSGFLAANPDLAARLASGEIPLTGWFNELLRLVYRLIFLMVAEDRTLLHPKDAAADARRLYTEGYSLTALRAQCVRRASWDRHHDRYEGLKVVFRALARGEPALGLPALGGLFAPDRLPHLETAVLPNRAFMEAVYRLSWLTDGTAMVPVNWRAMETEELGSVYESLLELQPQLAGDGRALAFASDAAERRGNQRKTTGSYYTPDSLVQALLDTALDPVLDRAEAESDDKAATLLALTVIDPACGSGHFLLAAARRIATRVARIRAEGTPSLEDFRHALRDVARCCLHGVDKNPMAVELTKVALWIETVDPGLPLGFFDAQIRCGDSLLGVFDLKALEQGIPDAAYKPLSGDDKETAKHFAKRNRSEKSGQGSLDFARGGGSLPAARQLADLGADLRHLPETTLAEIQAKDARFRESRRRPDWYRWKIACDAYVAAFLAPKVGGVPANRNMVTIPTTTHVWEAMAGHSLYGPLVARVDQLAEAAHAFHWPLEFPDIMERGGFDVVVGNPPWEVMQLSGKEYFATRKPEIAALAGAARTRAIEALEHDDPAVFQDFVIAQRVFDASNEFARESGRFELTGRGKINTYALFAEVFANLIGPTGRAGVIVPTGIATDVTAAPFFAGLIRREALVHLTAFENEENIFPAVHHAFKFAILVLSNEPNRSPEFCFFLRKVAQLADPERNFTLTPDAIARLNPNTRTAPVFRSRADAELTAKIYKNSGIFIEMNGRNEISAFSPIVIQNFFSGSNRIDSEIFEKYFGCGPADSMLPVFRGGDISIFDHRFGIDSEAKSSDNEWFGDGRFAPKEEVIRRLSSKGWRKNWLIGWRDIARSVDERTVIAAAFPVCATDDTLSLLLPGIAECKIAGALLGNLNSLSLDYAAQSKVGGTHIRKNVIAQFPILPPTFYTESRLSFVIPKVLELTYTSHSLAPFARDLGYDGPPFRWDEERRALLRADLDAFYARAYGLDRDELRYILDPADVKGPDYPSETFRVLKERETRQFGEYRTRRLVLAAWDRMEADGSFANLGLLETVSV
ncbi:Eco57I restriction-modification methylase domain-containing protein [Azospirillum halopraeferens]|uniref:Eco57I restriction-modification methylase domain-containing protein n=1 Tax=Azospirillum halopraeferens TaxID=34010 RepID=UPI00041F1F57|nr:N-6 DNA methylase [Azospirillum halopraeferens]